MCDNNLSLLKLSICNILLQSPKQMTIPSPFIQTVAVSPKWIYISVDISCSIKGVGNIIEEEAERM